MKVKIELFGAARDFSEQNLLEFDLDQKSLEVVKDFAEKITNKNISLVNNINKAVINFCMMISFSTHTKVNLIKIVKNKT